MCDQDSIDPELDELRTENMVLRQQLSTNPPPVQYVSGRWVKQSGDHIQPQIPRRCA